MRCRSHLGGVASVLFLNHLLPSKIASAGLVATPRQSLWRGTPILFLTHLPPQFLHAMKSMRAPLLVGGAGSFGSERVDRSRTMVPQDGDECLVVFLFCLAISNCTWRPSAALARRAEHVAAAHMAHRHRTKPTRVVNQSALESHASATHSRVASCLPWRPRRGK